MPSKEDLQKQIAAWDRRLQKLKQRQAQLGFMTDPSIETEIEDIEQTIKGLWAQLEELGDIKDLPVPIAHLAPRDQQYQIALHWAEDGKRCNLSRFDLGGTDLRAVNLQGANLSAVNLSEALLVLANLRDADLRTANLSKANLSKAALSRANLSGANLSEAILRQADLGGAILNGANLNKAILSGAYLSEADLTDADLRNADLTGVDPMGVTLDGVKYNRNTKWPISKVATVIKIAGSCVTLLYVPLMIVFSVFFVIMMLIGTKIIEQVTGIIEQMAGIIIGVGVIVVIMGAIAVVLLGITTRDEDVLRWWTGEEPLLD